MLLRKTGIAAMAMGVLWMAGSAAARAQEGRIIAFSGYQWRVKSSAGKVGPGPNYFSDSKGNVWVDASGRLHLKITKNKNRWQCAEVVCLKSLGYGTYRFILDSPVDALDPQVVLGLFTWSDDPAYHHREIDIEFTRWANPDDRNAQYVVQPYEQPENIARWQMPPGAPQSTHEFRWQSDRVTFQSVRGLLASPLEPNSLLQSWTYAGAEIPVPGDENARLNLWLFRGRAPSNRREVEVIVRRFEFLP